MRPASAVRVTSAPPPYLTALSIRLEIARRNAAGRPETVTPRIAGIGHRRAGVRSVFADAFDQGVEVDERARLVLGVVSREGEDRAEHRAHRVEFGDHFLLLLRVFADFEAQLKAGERGAKIVRHRGEHLHAVVVEAAQALLHTVEGIDRDLQLARPLRRQRAARRRWRRAARRRRPAPRAGSPAAAPPGSRGG